MPGAVEYGLEGVAEDAETGRRGPPLNFHLRCSLGVSAVQRFAPSRCYLFVSV